jgi:hypothetical protein
MFATTLQFDFDLFATIPDISPDSQPGQRHYMIRNLEEYLSSWEISDLTIDCNLQNAPFDEDTFTTAPVTANVSGTTVTTSGSFFTTDMKGKAIVFANGSTSPPGSTIDTVVSATQATLKNSLATMTGVRFGIYGPRFSITAVAVRGDNIRIRRVRVINFGTRTPILFDGIDQPGYNFTTTFNRSYEGFPLKIEGRTADKPSFNSIIEDCVIEQPYPSPAREVTQVIGSGVGDFPGSNRLHLEPLGCAIRNCYMNFDFVNPEPGNPVAIDSISYSGSAPNVDASVTTRFPVGVAVGDYVEIYGNDVSALNGGSK